MCVLRGAKGLLLLALAQEGVTIDPNTLAASLTLPTSGKHPHTGTSSSGTGVGYSSSNLSVPSPRIFRKAEAVRCLLQEELSDLLRDIIVPVSLSPATSSLCSAVFTCFCYSFRTYPTVLSYAILSYPMLCYAMLCYAMLCYTILYYTILYYTMLYYTIL